PDQNNFIKLAVENNNGVPSIPFYSEKNGTRHDIGTKVAVTNPATLQSMELTLFCDATAGTISAGYHAVYPGNDAGLVRLSTSITLTGSQRNCFFAPKSKGGIITSSQNSTPTTVLF